MDKEWERRQTEKLVLKQELKIAILEKEISHVVQQKAKSEPYASETKKKKIPQNKINEE